LDSPQYSQSSQAYTSLSYNSIFQIDRQISTSSCKEEVLSYNVVFTLHNSTGGWAGYLVITEKQNMTVEGSQLQTQNGMARNTNTHWSGYEVKANSGASQPVYAAGSYFVQPTVSYPSGGCANSNSCNLGAWVGLTDSTLATGGNLAQDGTVADCINSGCTPSYFAFYEMLPAQWVQCTASNGGAVTISGGDQIYASTTNEAETGGSNTKYDFYIADTTSLTSCYMGGQSYSAMSSPKFGEFIVENPSQCSSQNVCDSLAAFGTAPYSAATIYTGGSFSTINNFYTGAYDMANQAGTFPFCYGTATVNVSYGSLNSAGSFTMTYGSSQYTPVYNAGC
jgi:hypothetical protein